MSRTTRVVVPLVVLGVVVGAGVFMVIRLSAVRAEYHARQAGEIASKQAAIAAYETEMASAREESKGRGWVAVTLASIAKDHAALTPKEKGEDGDAEYAIYDVSGIGDVGFRWLTKNPAAWSFAFESSSLKPSAFGPPGGVRDLLGAGHEPIGGFPISGLFHRIDDGPLTGAILLYSPPLMSGKPTFQIATVAYFQATPNLVMDGLCGFGLVPGKRTIDGVSFKSRCKALVGLKVPKPLEPVWKDSWGGVGSTDGQCNRAWTGEVEARGARGASFEFSCTYDASAGAWAASAKRK